MDKQINEVLSSKDYKKFSMLEGNRELRLSHVEDLKESMKTHPLEKPIDVNEKFEIIDGQHRYMAWWELGMPIIYIVHKGWGQKEVPILNTNQKNWNPSDFVRMYMEEGNENYKQYKEFADRWGFTHNANMSLLSGRGDGESLRKFREGKFEVKKWVWANLIARQIKQIGEVYPGYKRAAFVSAYVQLSQVKKFDHETLMGKISFQSRKLVDCTTVGEYYEMLREVYNYKSRGGQLLESYN